MSAVQEQRGAGAYVNNMPWDKPWPDPQHTPWKQWSDGEKASYAKEWDLTIEEAEALMTAPDAEIDEALPKLPSRRDYEGLPS